MAGVTLEISEPKMLLKILLKEIVDGERPWLEIGLRGGEATCWQHPAHVSTINIVCINFQFKCGEKMKNSVHY